MARNVCCYLKSLTHKNISVFLPNDCPVVIGRMPELLITDKTCSRNQLELRANYDKRYVLVKCLGANPSQVDGIEIKHHISSQLKPGQNLYIVNMKYPHHVAFENIESNPAEIDQTNSKDSLIQQDSKTVCEKNIKIRRKREHSSDDIELKNSVATLPESKTNTPQNTCEEYGIKPPEGRDTGLSKPFVSNFSGHWSQGLKSSMNDPNLIVYEDKLVVAIKDKYPKAKFHWLILPVASISNTHQLTSDHLSLLRHILKVGKDLAEVEMKKDKTLQFRHGYHAVASMSQLHMHAISQDFSSPCLKTKKHWNSFTTEYFVDAEEIIKEIQDDGKVKNRKSYTEFLKNPLKCHFCGQFQKNMPVLKRHIAICST